MTQPTVTLPREVAKQALDAFEEAKMGLEWYQTSHPESVDGSDDEAMERIDAGIASLRAALDAPAKPVDCPTCKLPFNSKIGSKTLFCTCNKPNMPVMHAPVDCRGCFRYTVGMQSGIERCTLLAQDCTDFDKFQALPPIVLTKVTK